MRASGDNEFQYHDDDSHPCPAGWTRLPSTDLEASDWKYGMGLLPRCFYNHEDNSKIPFEYPIPRAAEEVEKPTMLAQFISCVTQSCESFY
jgi:hypothetical protein